jgi:hypothetical protein
MHIKRNDEERIVIVHFSWMAAVIGQLPAVVLIWLAASGNFHPAKNQPVGSFWLCALFFVLFAVGWDALLLWFAELSDFNFDLMERRLVWSRRNVFRKKAGIIPFDQIRGATVDILSSSNGTSYRLVINSQAGTVPVTSSYTGRGRPSVAKELGRIAETVNAALKTNPASEMEDQILALAAAGQRLAAVQLARQRYGGDLNRASRFVDELTKKPPDKPSAQSGG